MPLPDALKEDEVGKLSERLLELLRAEIARISSKGEPISVSFSGGLDSTLLAKLSLDFAPVECIVAGAPGSIDLVNARKAAERLKVDLKEIELTEESVLSYVMRIIEYTGVKDPVLISFEIPLVAVLQESTCKIILTGQGSDELFGGYSKYHHLSEREFSAMRGSDIEKLMTVTMPIEDRIALLHGKRIERPFMSEQVLLLANSLDVDLLMPDAMNKRLIREMLLRLGLSDIAKLPKKAAQYGSGAMKIIRKIAKSRGQSVGELIESLVVRGK